MAEAVPRSGIGFDVHRFSGEGDLWLGGVRFAGYAALVGHSDGDVVCHALADALLGASALGDVGQHFPEVDPAVAGIAGLDLLGQTVGILARAGFAAASCDVTVICEEPAIAPHRDEMRAALAGALGVDASQVSVKATRPEGLGLVGDGVGCLTIAVVT